MTSRNTEANYAITSSIDCPRSSWDRSKTHKTSFNNGKLVPFYINMDIIPGTTIKNRTTIVLRMSTPLNPTMDNLYMDTYYFVCNKYWYWDHWRAMMGENDYGAWAQTVEYSEPQITTENTNYKYGPNDLAAYYGIRQGIGNLSYSKMAVNCYIDVWNQYFRDQNLQAPIMFDTTDTDLTADNTIETGFGLLPVQKFHDYFTSCLPQPQKGSPITTPLGTTAPVFTGPNNDPSLTTDWSTSLRFYKTSDGSIINPDSGKTYPLAINHGTNGGILGVPTAQQTSVAQNGISPANLHVDLTLATAATINALRLAFAAQRILERDSMGGTRYPEVLANHYRCTPADESLKRPIYIGGHRCPVNIETVLQNSSTDNTSPLGYTGAVSVTLDMNEDFTFSFDKDQILIGLMCVRADHTYGQGIPRQLKRGKRLDRYWPELAHIGNQPVYNYEIFAQGSGVVDNVGRIVDNQVFGYKEAWQEYMYDQNIISGELSVDYAQSLDVWHYGDDYATLPVLSDNWIREPQTFVDRTLAVQSSTHNQFIADILVEQDVTAPIPLHRTPGLIDHF